MPTTQIPERLREQLLRRHFGWHLRVGMVIWAGVVLVISLISYFLKRQSILQYASTARLPTASTVREMGSLVNEYISVAFYLFIFGLIPAIIGGIIRRPFLAHFSRKARTRGELVWKSLLLFLTSVALLSLIPWPVAYYRFTLEIIGYQFRLVLMLSLPWIITTGLASWKLAADLALPSKATRAVTLP